MPDTPVTRHPLRVTVPLTPKSFLFTNYIRENTEAVFEQAFVDDMGCEFIAKWIVKTEHITLINKAIRRMIPAKRITT